MPFHHRYRRLGGRLKRVAIVNHIVSKINETINPIVSPMHKDESSLTRGETLKLENMKIGSTIDNKTNNKLKETSKKLSKFIKFSI